MNILIKLLAPFLLRLLRHFGPKIPGINHQALERNRRKLTATLTWAVLSLVSILGSVLTAVIDAAVQFEQHGGVEFNVVMISALGAFVFAIVAALMARASLPGLQDLMDVGRRGERDSGRAANGKIKPGQPRRPGFAR